MSEENNESSSGDSKEPGENDAEKAKGEEEESEIHAEDAEADFSDSSPKKEKNYDSRPASEQGPKEEDASNLKTSVGYERKYDILPKNLKEGNAAQLVDPKVEHKIDDDGTATWTNEVDVFHHDAEVKGGISVEINRKDWKQSEANLTVVDATFEGSAFHGKQTLNFDIGQKIKNLFSSKKSTSSDPTAPPPPGGGGPFAARVGDPTSHGSPLFPGIGSTNVLIGYMPAWRAEMDFHLCPVVKVLIPDIGGIVLMGSPTVLINNMPACRAGDMVVEIPGGPNAIAVGCPTVMIGASAGGGGGGGGGAGGEGESSGDKSKGSGLTLAAETTEDLDYVKAELSASIKANKDEQSAEVKAGAIAAVAHGTAKAGLRIPIPFTSDGVTFGGAAEGFAGGAGAEASASIVHETGKGWHSQAHLGAALGIGAGFSLSLGFD